MTNELFRSGGPLNVQKVGRDEYQMSVKIPAGEDGRTARECPDENCSPGYFKVKSGTGIVGGQIEAFCPYCRHKAEPNKFVTKEQVRFARDHAIQEAKNGVERMIKNALGLGSSNSRTMGRGGFISMEMSYKPSSRPPIRRPAEDSVRRDVVCPHCGLDHSVYGLAVWCADCGTDIFLIHVDKELAVVEAMLGDVARRHEVLGDRVAGKDLENCLEDIVSIFEAVLKIIARRALAARGVATEEIERVLQVFGSGFQSITRTADFLSANLSLSCIPGLSPAEAGGLRDIFEKRHPITHNLGVVDRKYLKRVSSGGQEGREVTVTPQEVTQAISLARRVFKETMASLPGP